MAKRNYTGIEHDGFRLTWADARQTASNIERVFVKRTSWFSIPKPMSIRLLEQEYHHMCPDMEPMFPGVVSKILQPEILRKLGFPVSENGLVHWSDEA